MRVAENLSVARARAALEALTVGRGLLRDPVVKRLRRVLEALSGDGDGDAFAGAYAGFFHTLLAHNSVRPLADYLVAALLYDDNTFARMAAAADFADLAPDLVRAMARDLDLLAGLPANNILLYGDRGTGKSSTDSGDPSESSRDTIQG